MTLPCTGHSALFDSTDPADHEQARQMCATCPAFRACASLRDDVCATAGRYGQPEGTWAGVLLYDEAHHYSGDELVLVSQSMRVADEDARYSKFDAARAHREYESGMRSEWINAGERVWQRAKKRRQRRRTDGAA